MGQQSSKNAIPPEDALKIGKILSESPQFEQSAKRMSSKRTSEKGLRPKEFLTEHQIAIRETNEAIDFVQDFVLLYSAPLQTGINFNTNPLLTFHARTLGSSETLGDANQSYQSMASAGGRDKPKLLRNKVKSIIQSTDQSAAELKNVLTDMNTQQKSRFSFARQRMDFHREPAKLAKVVGSSMPSYIAKDGRDGRDGRDNYGSQNNSLNLALQAKGVIKSSGTRNRDSPESLREVNRSRHSPEVIREAVRVRSSPKEMRQVGRGGRDSPQEYRQPETREFDRPQEYRQPEFDRRRDSPQEYQQEFDRQQEYRQPEAREFGRGRNSPEQYRRQQQQQAPVFGDRIRESREYPDDRTYENIRREKKERDNKTHESLLILKDDIDRIKGDLQRSKSSTREPRRSNDKVFSSDGSPSLSSYQGLTRDTKSPHRDDPYQRQAQPRRVNEPAISVSTTFNSRQGGYPPQHQNTRQIPPYDREPGMYQSNPQYIQKKETFGKNDENQMRAMKYSQPPPQRDQYYNDYNERPKSPMTADFAGPQPQRRNEYERPLARSQSPINDNSRSQHQQLPIYQSQTIPQNQNRSQNIINKQVAQKIDNNRYISEPNHHYAEREQGLNYGQINVQKSRSDNFNTSQSQLPQNPQNFMPTKPNHPNLLNLLTPQKATAQQNEQFMLNTQRSKLNFSGIVSDVNGSYSFDDDNEVQPVSMNLNLEDLLNDSQLHIPQKSKGGYQQPPQAKNNYPKSTVPSYNDRNRNPPNTYENQRYERDQHNNYQSNPNLQRSGNYDPRYKGPNALFNLSESMIAKNDAYNLPSTDRDYEPVMRRSKWDVGHGNGSQSARGQFQSNYQTNPVVTSGQYRKY